MWREGHNLDRCRTQFKLVKDMEEKLSRMKEIVNKYKQVKKNVHVHKDLCL